MSTEPEAGKRLSRLWAPALLALALLLRIGFVLQEPRGFYFYDSVDYDRAAQSLLQTGSFDHLYDHLPLYPLLMATVYRIAGTGLLPLRLVQALLSTGICLCVWILGRRLFGERAGLLALAASALFPVQVVLAGIEYPVVLGTLLIWGALSLFCRREGTAPLSPGRLAAAGLLAGLASMTFEAGAALALFLVLWVLIAPAPWGVRLRRASLLAVAVLATLTPWVLIMTKADNFRPVFRRAAVHLPTAPGDDPPLAAGNGENLLENKLGSLLRHPGFTVKYMAGEFVQFWNPYPNRLWAATPEFRKEAHREDPRMLVDNPLVGERARVMYTVVFSVLLALALAGAGIALRKLPRSRFLAGWPVFLGLAYAPFFTQTRYRIPADPAFFLLGAYALDTALEGALARELKASLAALWEGWKRIALKIAVVQTFILLFLLFVVGMGPIAILMKLFRKDPLDAGRQEGTFWVLRERTRESLAECLRQF